MKTAVTFRLLGRSVQIFVSLMAIVGFPCAAGNAKGSSESEKTASSTNETPRVSELFDEDVLADNVCAVLLKARQLPTDARYQLGAGKTLGEGRNDCSTLMPR